MKDKELKDKIEIAFVKSSFKWRTPKGIASDTNLPINQVYECLERSGQFFRAKKVNKHGEPLYTLESKVDEERTLIQRIIARATNQD